MQETTGLCQEANKSVAALRRPVTVTVVAAAVLALHNAQRLAPVSLFEELRLRLHTTYVGVGNLFGAYLLTYALFSIPAGLLADRRSAKRLMAGGAGLSLLASGLFAVTQNYLVAMGARCLLGVGGAFLYVPTVRYVATSFSAEQRGLVMGCVQAGAGLGMILPLALLPGLAQVSTPAQAFLFLPGISALVLVAVLFGVPPQHGSAGPARSGRAVLGASRSFWYYLAYFFLMMLAHYAASAWLPTYLRADLGYSAVDAGLTSTLVSIAMVVGSPLAGFASDRFHTRLSVLLTGSLGSAIGFGIFVLSGEPTVIIGASLLCGVSIACTVPIFMMAVAESVGIGGAGLAVSVAASVGQIASSLSGPLFGFVFQLTGNFKLVWETALIMAAASVPCLLLAWRASVGHQKIRG